MENAIVEQMHRICKQHGIKIRQRVDAKWEWTYSSDEMDIARRGFDSADAALVDAFEFALSVALY